MADQMMQHKADEFVAKKATPAGYKTTELGVIPQDWECLKIEEVCNLINGRGFKPFEWGSEGLPIIRIQNLNGSEEYNYYAGSYDAKIEVDKEQLLFAWSGSRGTSFGPHIWHGPKSLLNYHTWKVVIKNDKLDSKYFFYALKGLTKSIEDAAHGASALVHTQMGEMKKFMAPVPNNILEQVAISNALADTDALIAGLEQLVAKKQAIKTATMQQLLTGRTRLPQFALRPDGTPKGYKSSELGQIPEDWITPTLKGITSNIIDYRGRTPRKLGLEWGGGNILALSAGNVKKGFIDYEAECYFGSDELYKKWMTSGDASKGDIVFTMEAPLGNVALIPNEDKYILSQRTILLQLERSKFLPKFIIQVFLSDMFQSYISESATGSTAQGIKRATFEKMFVAVPSCLEEQTAIATILSDMDSELTALEQKLAKARDVKQGMMQQLLTGRIRLPLSKEA